MVKKHYLIPTNLLLAKLYVCCSPKSPVLQGQCWPLCAGTFHITSSLAYTLGPSASACLSCPEESVSSLMGEDLYPDLIEPPMATRIFLSECRSASPESAHFQYNDQPGDNYGGAGFSPPWTRALSYIYKVQLVGDNFKGIPSGVSRQALSPGTSLLRPAGIHFLDSPPEFSPGPQRKGSNNSLWPPQLLRWSHLIVL